MFKKAKMLVIGDVMIDHYIYGDVDRLSPEAPVPILEMHEEHTYLGGAGVVASNLARLGADTSLLSVCGTDSDSAILKRLLEEDCIGDSIVRENGRKTIKKNRFVATSPYFQQLLRVDNESRKNIGPETELEVISKMEAEMAKADIIVVSDYNKGLLTKQVISRLLERAKKSGKKIIVDTKRSMMDYKGVDYIVPNFKELCIAFATKPTNEDGFILPHTEELSKKLGCTVIVKRSGKGATIADKAGTRTYPTAATDIINVSGAGDIFVAILSLALASGKTIDEAVKLANAGCAKAITRRHPSVSPGDF